MTFDDYCEIQNLYANYNFTSDAAQPEAYAACFTGDGTLEIAALNVKVEGRSELVKWKEKDRDSRAGRLRRHWNNNIALEHIDAETVRGRCYILAFNGAAGELPAIADCGSYEDLIVLDRGVWRFKHRRLTLDVTGFGKASSKGEA